MMKNEKCDNSDTRDAEDRTSVILEIAFVVVQQVKP